MISQESVQKSLNSFKKFQKSSKTITTFMVFQCINLELSLTNDGISAQ